MIRKALALAVLACATLPAFAQAPPDHPGRAVYQRACASCHDNPGATRAISFGGMQQLPGARIRESLTTGLMQPMAAGLSTDDVTNLIAYLTANQRPVDAATWHEVIMCPADKRTVDVTKAVVSAGFGVNPDATRALTAKQAGLKTSQMKNLEPAWAIAYPGGGAGNGGSLLGDTLFINLGGRLLALDPVLGCAKWTYAASSRNSPAIGDVGGRKVLAFVAGRDVHVVDAASGQLVWKASGQPETGSGGQVRGGVVFAKDKIVVPISASGVASGANPRFECCTGHGSVVALNAADGKRVWEWHTMPEATYNGQVNSLGVKQRGPSGAPIWSVPLVDEKRNRIVITSGEDTSHPTTLYSDAVVSLDLDTGKEAWSFQAMAGDVWNMACDIPTQTNGPNCPLHFGGEGKDLDFGAGAVLAKGKGKGGKDILLAGQKSGHVWAIDPDTGKVLWSQRIGVGTALGGVHWGIATQGNNVIVAINDPIAWPDPTFVPKAGVYALDIRTGKQKWAFPIGPRCDGTRATTVSSCKIRFGFSAAPVVVDGAVIAGTLGGEVFVLDAKTGKQLKHFDFIGPQTTLNANVPGKGGSIDSHGLFAGAGTVFVNSGYGSFDQTPGNVLIALKPKK